MAATCESISKLLTIYRQIQSLKEYLVLCQDQARAEQHVRNEDGLWVLRQIKGIAQVIQLASLDAGIAMADNYDKVVFATTGKLD